MKKTKKASPTWTAPQIIKLYDQRYDLAKHITGTIVDKEDIETFLKENISTPLRYIEEILPRKGGPHKLNYNILAGVEANTGRAVWLGVRPPHKQAYHMGAPQFIATSDKNKTVFRKVRGVKRKEFYLNSYIKNSGKEKGYCLIGTRIF